MCVCVIVYHCVYQRYSCIHYLYWRDLPQSLCACTESKPIGPKFDLIFA